MVIEMENKLVVTRSWRHRDESETTELYHQGDLHGGGGPVVCLDCGGGHICTCDNDIELQADIVPMSTSWVSYCTRDT